MNDLKMTNLEGYVSPDISSEEIMEKEIERMPVLIHPESKKQKLIFPRENFFQIKFYERISSK